MKREHSALRASLRPHTSNFKCPGVDKQDAKKWLEDNKKRPASAPSDEPAPKPKHRAAALASAPASSAAAGVSVLHLRTAHAKLLRVNKSNIRTRACSRTPP